jgi:hypothetical protein
MAQNLLKPHKRDRPGCEFSGGFQLLSFPGDLKGMEDRDTCCHSPLEVMAPSSYFLISTKSTKSLGEISFMAAEGVEVLLTHNVCQSNGV